MNFAARKPLMLFMLATMLLPGQLTMAPAYVLAYKLHLIDTYTGLILPGAVNVFGIFLFRQAIMQIPTELMQAARMDGCSEFRIYWDIVMPVTRPMIGAFALLSFMGSWNNFVGPQIMLHTSSMYTLPDCDKPVPGRVREQLRGAHGGNPARRPARDICCSWPCKKSLSLD